jgi:two-component system KDP operon response regulator KdpE
MTQAPGARILVVEDEPSILRAVKVLLTRYDFRVDTAETGQQALQRYASARPDLVLLDLGLPDVDGMAVLQQLRAHTSTPVVVLSVRGAERDKVAALEAGADDYLTKPFGVDELLARIRVALRHAARPASGSAPVFRTGELRVDLERRRVTVGDREVHLTPTEYEILKAFVANPNKVLTRTMLLRQVWGPGYGDEGHYLHVYLTRLRKKIESDPQNPRFLVTDPGVGYRLLAEEE